MQIFSKPSPNFNDRRDNKKISMLVMHYTGMRSAKEALNRLCDPTSQVSAHYMIDETGQIFKLVEEDKRAWHAGVGYWRGETDLNSISIGIEIVNPGHEFGYVPFPAVQMRSVMELSKRLAQQYDIKPVNVVGHSDIAPSRKEDPGELFDWKGLAQQGVGLWASAKPSGIQDTEDLIRSLGQIGYEIEKPDHFPKIVEAFQRHWRADKITGAYDQETADIAFALLQHVRRLT